MGRSTTHGGNESILRRNIQSTIGPFPSTESGTSWFRKCSCSLFVITGGIDRWEKFFIWIRPLSTDLSRQRKLLQSRRWTIVHLPEGLPRLLNQMDWGRFDGRYCRRHWSCCINLRLSLFRCKSSNRVMIFTLSRRSNILLILKPFSGMVSALHRLKIWNSFRSSKSLPMLPILPDSFVNTSVMVDTLQLSCGDPGSVESYRFGHEADIHISLMARNEKKT